MIHKAVITNELTKLTAGYKNPVVKLLYPRINPVSGDLITIQENLAEVIFVIVEIEKRFNHKFKCKLLTRKGSIMAGWIFQ